MRQRFLLFSALLLLWGVTGRAQEIEPLFHRISLEQGLSDARVTFITQDRYGFMWFGTANGLNRYDGYNIKVYEEGESGLRSNSIAALYCSKAGTLYVSDGAGLLEYNYTTDRFECPKGTDSTDLNRKRYTIWLMEEDAVGRIYMGGPEGFFRYTPAKALLEDVNKLVSANGAITRISGLTFGKDGRLWITTQKRGFFIVDPRSNTYREVPHDRQYGHDSCCYAIHRTVFLDDDHLLVGQHSYGLTVLDTRTLQFTAQTGLLGKNDSVRFNAVYRLIKDYKGRIWGGTAYFGLVQYLPETKGIIQYKYDPLNPDSYGGYRIQALYEDRDHNIWVGTGGFGIYRFHPDKSFIRYFPWNPISQRSPPGPEVLSTAARDSGTAWIGTDKGPAMLNIKSGIFKAYPYENSYHPFLPGSNINQIYTDRSGKIWFASRHLGITRYDEAKGQFIRFHSGEQHLIKPRPDQLRSPIPENVIDRITEHPEGNLVLLINRRIVLFDTRSFVSRHNLNDSTDSLLKIKNVADLVSRRSSELIIATQSGKATNLLSYSFEKRQSRLLATLDTGGATRVNSLQLLPDGNIAVGTSKGIYVVSAAGGVLNHYLWQEDGAHNNIRAIITGIPGVIWACTDRHIGHVDLSTGSWQWLGANEGIRATRLFGDAFKLLPGGQIIAGTSDGLLLISPWQITRNVLHAPLLVDFKVYGKPFHLSSPLQDADEIRLNYKENFFSFSMSTLHFGEGSDIEYSYKLDGFDKDWQPAGTDRSGQYTSVPGGNYTLLLRARSGTAEWVNTTHKIRIIIGKPWWNTWGVRILAFLLLGGIIAMIYFNRVRSIRKAAGLRSEYEIRLNELEMSALRTQMNPHFIFNCLNTINSFINTNQKTAANQYITRFAKLIRLILENSRKRRIPLSSELEALELYIQLEQLRFSDRFDYTIEVAPDVDTDNVEVPPLVLQPFVENAILHGILPKTGTGHIKITVRQEANTIRYTIQDDGVGRAAAKKRDEEGVLKKESHGMNITMKRIELFNKENKYAAEVIITDLSQNGQPSGTKVEIPLALVEGF